MYRIQLSGNEYKMNEEIGLHYQIAPGHRGSSYPCTMKVTFHSRRPFLWEVIPLMHSQPLCRMPEGLSELTFAGMLAGRRFRYTTRNGYGNYLSSDADFVITGTIRKNEKKPEGPFGDHLGYYSLEHGFPVMEVENVYYRKNAIWHFTVVGRPPQEDSSFGFLIHELVKLLAPQEFPGVKELNAVDASRCSSSIAGHWKRTLYAVSRTETGRNSDSGQSHPWFRADLTRQIPVYCC